MGILPKFFSKKGHIQTPIASVSEEQLKQKILTAKSKQKKKMPLSPETVTFYGRNIRRVLVKKQWYFFLEDIIAASGMVDIPGYLLKLKKSKEYKEESQTYIRLFAVTVEGLTKEVECLDAKGFAWILPMLQKDDVLFPGPFPLWISQNATAN